VSDAPADYVDSMLGAIVGIEIVVERWVGKWKVSQNRSAEDRAGVAAGLRDQGHAGGESMAQCIEGATDR
jgi:transcriptional regulator